jgi:hypothetical protein
MKGEENEWTKLQWSWTNVNILAFIRHAFFIIIDFLAALSVANIRDFVMFLIGYY